MTTPDINLVNGAHPHEPEVPATLDAEGRCLVCVLICERDDALFLAEQATRENFEARTVLARVGALADRWWSSGQQTISLPGVANQLRTALRFDSLISRAEP